MEKPQDNFYEWPRQPSIGDGNGNQENHRKNPKPDNKESPETMIRSLQGIFCKGRYRSWVVSRRR